MLTHQQQACTHTFNEHNSPVFLAFMVPTVDGQGRMQKLGEGGGGGGHEPRLHGHSDPDPDPDWLRLHGGKVDSYPDSDHLSHVDCDPDSNPDSGPGARVNAAME